MEGVVERDRVDSLRSRDVSAALTVARRIAHPWYRCQSLAAVASSMDDNRRAGAVLDEALAAAFAQSEPNRVVTVASWPVRVMVARHSADTSAVVKRLLATIDPEPNPVRRGDALLALLYAVFPLEELRHAVLAPLLAAVRSSRGWKSRRITQFAALLMAEESQTAAEAIVAEMPPSREQRRTRKQLEERFAGGMSTS
jgi:hypothetical protein